MELVANMRTTNSAFVAPIFRATMAGISAIKFCVSFISMTKLQEINRDQQTN